MSASFVPQAQLAPPLVAPLIDRLGPVGVELEQLAPTVDAGAAPMQALLGEPEEAIGSPSGSPGVDRDQGDEDARG